MPTIAFVSSKGGVGKTTSALLLALGLAERGLTASLVDSDPNLPLTSWAERPGKPDQISLFHAATFQDLPAALRSAKRGSDWVIVDTEGGAPRMGGMAIANADLVITPLAASALEVREALKIARLTGEVSRKEGRPIAFTCLFSRTPAGVRRSFQAVRAVLQTEGLPILSTVLSDKEAFRAIFSDGGSLADLNPRRVSGLKSARALAADFTEEVYGRF